jgi:two-component system sensor histidine kinase KdpD
MLFTAWMSSRLERARHVLPDWRHRDALGAALLLAAATVVMLAVREYLNVLNVALLFLILVVCIAMFASRWTSAASAALAFLLFDFFFILPYYTFNVAATDHVLALFVFLGVSVVTSQLVYRARSQTMQALARGRQMGMLFELSQALIADITSEGILAAVTQRVAAVLGASSCAVLLPDEGGALAIRAVVGPPPPLYERDHAAIAEWSFQQRLPVGLGQRRGRYVATHGKQQPGRVVRRLRVPARQGTSLYVPIATSTRTLGLLYIQDAEGRRRFTEADQQLLSTFANQLALALERVRLTEEATRAAVLARSDELKSALLSAVSHDLRTPLASIKASATSLLQPDIQWSADDRRDLLQAIDEETDRLTRLVGNLLDMTRIEAGVLKPQLEWNDPAEVVRHTVQRAQATVPDHTIVTHLPEQLPLLRFDYVEIGQVLFNLLENAGKYAPPRTTIDVRAVPAAGAVEFSVADRGPGIPSGEEERIFSKFYRLEQRRGPGGAGIGLSICRGLVEAHGGAIWVTPRDGGGATFHFTLPEAVPLAAEPAPMARAEVR